MTPAQAKKLKKGDRIKWHSLDGSLPDEFGTVTEVHSTGFEIEWDKPDPDSGETYGQCAFRPERTMFYDKM